MSDSSTLVQAFEETDRALAALEAQAQEGRLPPVEETVERAIAIARQLMVAYLRDEGRKPLPPDGADLLEVWKVLVKGEPFWNTIRDNLRELIYYRNCLALGRADALPAVPEKMAVRTARHLHLFFKTRCIREGRIAA
ncbi:hypothetical protein [Pelomicrobium sp.]|uniref:hypothetical protein n=1 Tax=Pelomicrobium sp. TaxID=2815319 RepID=UPI002FDD640B